MGTLYKRGRVWWCQYYQNGKPYQESSKSRKKMVAHALLKQREGEIGQGKIPGIYFDKVLFNQLAEGFLSDYKINEKKSIRRAKGLVDHLKTHFDNMPVPQITTPRIQAYIEDRLNQGAANATVNRELAALKRMLNLGAQQTPPLVDRTPFIKMLKENNTRKGFFEKGEFFAVRDNLPNYLKGYVTFAFKTGWRKEEISNLTWSQVDLDQNVVRLEPGTTKNSKGRTVYLDEELKEVFQRQWDLRKEKGILTHFVFTNETGTNKIKEFRKSWKTALLKASVGNKLFHDLRRTAIRNLVRSGVPERVAMLVSGHRTRSIFDRYDIVSDTDLKLAAQRQEIYLNSQTIAKTITIADFPKKEGISQDD